MKKLHEKNYIAIADWMLNLGLNTRELLVYAIIYSFSQNSDSCYYGSFAYLAAWLGMKSSQNVNRYLKTIVNDGFVIKKEIRTAKNQKACLYKALVNKGPIIDNPDIDYIIIQPWMIQDLHLNGKDLLLYALVHGYSRRGSENVCTYQKEYMAKWLQCRKDHVDRQVNQAIKKKLIKEIRPGEFVALVPEDINITKQDNICDSFEYIDVFRIDNEFTQTESTPDNTHNQTESILPKTESTLLPKVRDNNLYTNNLNNNLFLNNNNSNQNKTNIYYTKEQLSVVVNEIIDKSNLETKEDFNAFKTKEDLDYRLYQKYQKKNPKVDMSLLMKKVADLEYRTILLNKCFEEKRNYEEVFDTVYSTIMLNRFSTYSQAINNLSEKDIRGFVVETDNLFDNSQKNNVWKSKKAYLIGMFQNILDQN